MSVKKGNNRKKPRTPITKTKSDSKQETKVTTLLGLGGLAVLAVVAGAIIIMMLVRGSDNVSVKPDDTIKTTENITISDALQSINLTLFSFGFDKNVIKEEVRNDNRLKVTLDIPEKNRITIMDNIAEELSKLGFDVEQSDSVEGQFKNLSVFIGFMKAPEKTGPKIAFVIDDCGYSEFLAKKLSSVKYPITFAVLPHLKYSTESAQIIRDAGQTVFLHQPMQPRSYPKTDPGKGAVLLNMPEKLIKIWLEKNLEDIGKIDGFNNHMGSAITENSEKMKQVLSFMSEHTDFFLDSYTSRESVAYDECLKTSLKCAQNMKFIDNETDYDYIRSKIIEGVEIARDKGSVIMIGHLKEETVDALIKILPELEAAGYTMVSVTELANK